VLDGGINHEILVLLELLLQISYPFVFYLQWFFDILSFFAGSVKLQLQISIVGRRVALFDAGGRSLLSTSFVDEWLLFFAATESFHVIYKWLDEGSQNIAVCAYNFAHFGASLAQQKPNQKHLQEYFSEAG